MTFKEVKKVVAYAIESEWHQHQNGGGWVQDTAYVSGDACVSGNARVLGNAQVYDDAEVSGNACVYGDAQVSGDAEVYGDAWVTSPLYIQPSAHAVTVSSYTEVSIGCKRHSVEWWLEHYEEVGNAEKYTDSQIDEYGIVLKFVKQWMETFMVKLAFNA